MKRVTDPDPFTVYHFKGIALDPTTNDLFILEDGNLAMVEHSEAVGQHVRQRLKTFQGEWFLDTRAGVPWLERILGKNYNSALAEAVTKGEILDTAGVTEITTFAVDYDRTPRNLIIKNVEVLTIFDEEVQI